MPGVESYRVLCNRKLREAVKTVVDESRLLAFLTAFRDGLWPGGKLKPPSVPRTPEEKLQTRDEANRKLSALIPGTHMASSRRKRR